MSTLGTKSGARRPRAYSPMIVSKLAVAEVLHDAQVSVPKKPHVAGGVKGLRIEPAWRRNPQRTSALREAVARHVSAEWELGRGGFDHFDRQLQRAVALLGDEKVTATALLGEYLEIAFPDLKEVRVVLGFADHALLRLANTSVTGGKADFTDSRGQTVKVAKPFTTVTEVRDVWIKEPHQEKGQKYFDHGRLYGNGDGRKLPACHEFKSEVTGRRDLKEQITELYNRILKAGTVPGSVITYWEIDPKTGVETFRSTPVADLVMMRDTVGPFDRVGLRADTKQFSAKPALDKNKKPYLAVTVALNSTKILRVLETWLADPRWQRTGWAHPSRTRRP
ncbi:hypothetical protein [Streptomyces avermitilis]|uniref:hypothetical protein n=1 Tax=Streptomyces avermitilis TaxID=33903 RepID=UPI0037F20E08